MLLFMEKINAFVWGVPALLLILGTGIYLSLRTGFAQLRLFPKALRLFVKTLLLKNRQQGGISPYRALCTALAATVGTGNLVGVAGAISLGGPGSIFWMWMCALLGMVIKCAEASLAVYYREKDKKEQYVGGPMYMIRKGMHHRWAWLGTVYCFFGVVAALGVGNSTQINAMISGINGVIQAFGGREDVRINLVIGIASAAMVLLLLSGGAKRIGQAAEKIVPFAAVIYLLLGVGVLIIYRQNIPGAFRQIFNGAFKPRAVTGGAIGSTFLALRTGASRGVFTNEAGMGTASIAHASADVQHPIEQGLMGVIEVFIDTILICTMTAMVILCSGIPIQYGEDLGTCLTTAAFVGAYGSWVCVPVALILMSFAFATILGWGLYGARCAQYLFGDQVWSKFIWISSAMVMVGAVLKTDTVWLFSETVNGLMAIPNLIVIAWLAPEFSRLIKDYCYCKHSAKI